MDVFPQLRAERCTRYRFRYSTCDRCQTACPHAAISLSEEGAAIDAALCQNCALCAAACPTEAWQADNLARVDLLKQAAGRREIAYACTPSQAEGDARIPCLGALDAVMLAYLARRGVKTELRGAWHCEACAHGARGGEQLAQALAGLELLRAGFLAEDWAEVIVTESGETPADAVVDAGRRHLFRRFAGRAAADLGNLDPPEQPLPIPLKAVRIAAPVSTVRRELLQVLWPKEGDGELAFDPILPLADVRLGQGCNACEACARACPTGALSVHENQARWELAFQFSRCVACGLCLEACQPLALNYAPAVSLETGRRSEAGALLSLDKRRCARCDRSFITADQETLCPVCAGDDQDFTSVFG